MTISRWLVPSILLLGLSIRGYHYLRCPAVWHDEAALLVNVLELDYQEQLGPLIWHEAAPPLFLWAERTVYLAFGDRLQMLRLLPFLASCGTLLLLLPVCRTLLPKQAVPWALLLHACAEKLAWHACEAKPYALDAFLAVLLLYLICTASRRTLHRQLLYLTLLAPPFVFLSYPSTFLLGGAIVAQTPAVWRARRAGTWFRHALFVAVVCGSFLLLALGPAKAQQDGAMMGCWTTFFPDYSRPWWIPVWTALATLEVLRYCFAPLGQTLIVFAIVGGVVLWRQGRRETLALLVVPLLLAMVASFLHRYPYGGARVMVYAAPGLVVLIGAGIVPVIARIGHRGRMGVAACLSLLLLPGVQAVHRVVNPWERAETGQASSYVLRQCGPTDRILGNNWTHVYYFRGLKDQFQHFEGFDTEAGEASRAWILYTSQAKDEQRLREAMDSVPDGWQVVRHREFRYTTVLLAVEPNSKNGSSRVEAQ